ncbi:helix-turn-helix domain-containing protein [Salinisphaera sp. USBA-960]|uniref:RodZ domain-containing protein n=1 Tax=Salinisphaera orenii TaxID=856731 RepID=UPI000DBE8760|nr:helix-turn-helix domain-containing protein [Salifodinibacter halophilus]NNC25774.1 helix-turn-helix domain-containing protein [Salifodinibacter halophilus]
MTDTVSGADVGAQITENQADNQTPGELIREARVRLGLSLDDLGRETRLFKATLQQLEVDDYAALPQPVLAAGYYRQCARALRLDEEKLIAAYRNHGGASVALSDRQTFGPMAVAPADVTPTGHRRLTRVLLVILLLIALAVAAVVVLLPSVSLSGGGNETHEAQGRSLSVGQATSTASDTSAGSGQTHNQASASAQPESAENDHVQTGATQATAGGGDASSDMSSASGSGVTEHDDEQIGRLIQPPSGGREVAEVFGDPNSQVALARSVQQARANNKQQTEPEKPAVPADQLKLKFKGKSWVRVTGAHGNQLFQGIFKAGDSRVFKGAAPYHLVLGNVPGVEVVIGGQPYEVPDKNGDGVARLTIEAREEENTSG